MNYLQDFYFYTGLSHFALSRSKDKGIGKELRDLENRRAIQNLLYADSLTEGQDNYREAFFLGVVYGLSQDKNRALKKLENIKPESDFYVRSKKLIHRWSN